MLKRNDYEIGTPLEQSYDLIKWPMTCLQKEISKNCPHETQDKLDLRGYIVLIDNLHSWAACGNVFIPKYNVHI